jgi:hypothetical protein
MSPLITAKEDGKIITYITSVEVGRIYHIFEILVDRDGSVYQDRKIACWTDDEGTEKFQDDFCLEDEWHAFWMGFEKNQIHPLNQNYPWRVMSDDTASVDPDLDELASLLERSFPQRLIASPIVCAEIAEKPVN